MDTIAAYIETGILELYVIGVTSPEESAEIEQLAETNSDIREALEEIRKTMELYAEKHALPVSPSVKPFLMALIDYTERMEKGETVSFPPMLNENSRIEGYSEWLNRKDMVLPGDFEEIHAKIIGYTPEATSAIVWIKTMAPHEVHDDEFEKFLIVEGTCDITIGETIHHLATGDYLSIPLYAGHTVVVTSKIPCKLILQRVAA